MTEAEWLATADPSPMLDHLRATTASERKLRLLACACCRWIWEFLPDPRSRAAVEVAERFADELATPRELAAARNHALSAAVGPAWAAYWAANVKAAGPLRNVFEAAQPAPAVKAMKQAHLSRQVETWNRITSESSREQVGLIREVVGNPFRRPRLGPWCLGWEGGLVVRLARQVYDGEAFDQMPMLGDALEEAGCEDTMLLEHCRLPGRHLRGCWVLDVVLGRE